MKAFLIILVLLTGCTKEYIERPTCFKYLMLSDKYTGEMVFLRTDTIWTSGIHGLLSYACGDNLKKLENYKPSLSGCENGWQMIRYEVLK